MQIVFEHKVDNPHEMALYVSAVLAADKGIPSEIKPLTSDAGQCIGYDVVTDEQKVFRLLSNLTS